MFYLSRSLVRLVALHYWGCEPYFPFLERCYFMQDVWCGQYWWGYVNLRNGINQKFHAWCCISDVKTTIYMARDSCHYSYLTEPFPEMCRAVSGKPYDLVGFRAFLPYSLWHQLISTVSFIGLDPNLQNGLFLKEDFILME